MNRWAIMDTDRHYTNTQITRQRNGSNQKVVEKKKGKFDITNTHIHDHSFSWLGTSTSYGHCVVIYGFWLPLQTLLSTKSVKNQTKETGRSHFTMATYKYIRGHNYPSSVHQCIGQVYIQYTPGQQNKMSFKSKVQHHRNINRYIKWLIMSCQSCSVVLMSFKI